MIKTNHVAQDWYYLRSAGLTVFTLLDCETVKPGDEVYINGVKREVLDITKNRTTSFSGDQRESYQVAVKGLFSIQLYPLQGW